MMDKKRLGWAALLLTAVLLPSFLGSNEADASVRRFTHARVINGGTTPVTGVLLEYPKGAAEQSAKLKLTTAVAVGRCARIRACGCTVLKHVRVLLCLGEVGKAYQTVFPLNAGELGDRSIRYLNVIVGSNSDGDPTAQVYFRLSDGSFAIRAMEPATPSSCSGEGFEMADVEVGQDPPNGGVVVNPIGTDNYPFIRVRIENNNDKKRPVKKVIVKGFKGNSPNVSTNYQFTNQIPWEGADQNPLQGDKWANRITIKVVVGDADSNANDISFFKEYTLADSLCFIKRVVIDVGGEDDGDVMASVFVYPEVPNPPLANHACANPTAFSVPLQP